MAMPVLVERIVGAFRRGSNVQGWNSFVGVSNPSSTPLQAAFVKLREGEISEAELRLVERIEDRRNELSQSEVVATYQDFGAGDPDHPHTEQQLIDGVCQERRVADLVKASVPQDWGMILFRLIRQYKPSRLLELGSAMGISGSYQSAALWLNNLGHLFTLEGCPQMAEHAQGSISRVAADRATLIRGRFQDTLDSVLTEMGGVDFAFIDGHHDEEATIGYWNQIRPRLSSSSLVIFDDCDWSDGMQRAWRSISDDDEVSCAVDLGKFGLCLCNAADKIEPEHFSFSLT